jgi:hypothetical protein
LRIIEVADAAALAGDLFFRAFRQTIPDFPRHFVLVCEPPQQPPFTLGYVHQTAFHGGYLAGGLVVDAWKFRALGQAQQEEIRSRGGMGEWLMAESCRRRCEVAHRQHPRRLPAHRPPLSLRAAFALGCA